VKKIKITTAETSLKAAQSAFATNGPVKCKLIKDSKDELHIEGRPKLSIVKVPRLECGSGNADRPKPLPSAQQPIVPKLKLSALPASTEVKRDLGREKWIGAAASKDPLSLADSFKPLKASASEASKKLNFDEKSAPPSSGEPEAVRKVEMVSANFGAGKIRIKYGGVLSAATDDPAKPEAPEKEPHQDDGFSFTFSGRPTYSPSRVEPNGNVPTKGETLF
jgi:hypothetical protein